MKLCRALLLRLHLKGVKIARNVMKIRVHTCLLKWVPKSTFKFHLWESQQKCIFSTFLDHPWMRAKIAPNLIRIGVHAYLWNGYLNLLYNLNFQKMEKCNVLGLSLTKFDRGPKWLAIPKKYTCRDYLSNGCLNTISNFNFKKVKKSAFLRTWFDQLWLSAKMGI